MVSVYLFGDRNDKAIFKVTRYVNDNLDVMINVLLDFVEASNGNAEEFLPVFYCDNMEWTKMVYDLRRIVESDVIRDYLNPKYEYLLYAILCWWEDMKSDYEENDLIPIPLEQEIVDEICIEYEFELEEDKNYIIEYITNFEYYYDFLFQDHDFLPTNLETMTIIYIRSPKVFEHFLSDVKLDEYRDLMPNDLKEQYDKRKKEWNSQNKDTSESEINIELLLREDIMLCCERIQADNSIKNSMEDEINDRLRDLLNRNPYINVYDQTRQGASSKGKRSGEIDLLIKIAKKPISIIEALKLTSVNKSYIAEHINKIYKYDTLGYQFNFIICYVNIKDFEEFFNGYKEFVSTYEFPYPMIKYNIDKVIQYPELRIIEIILNRQGINTKLYNILIHMQG